MSNTQINSNTKTKTVMKYPERFNVVLFNDDYTPMQFVVSLLVEIFNKNINQAQEITMQVHNQGKAIAGTYNFEIAEQKVYESMLLSRLHQHPLKITIEKV
jgi:ATP-dependent Clp protease adaptor protein ClpS